PFSRYGLEALSGWAGANLIPREGAITAGQPIRAVLFAAGGPAAVPRLQLKQNDVEVALGQPVTPASRAVAVITDTGRIRGALRAAIVSGNIAVDLGSVTVTSPAPEAELTSPPQGLSAASAQFAGGLQLQGYRRQPGRIELIWRPGQALHDSLKTYVHVL